MVEYMKRIVLSILILFIMFTYSNVYGTWLVRKLSTDQDVSEPAWSIGESVMSTTAPTWIYGRSYVLDK